MSRHPRARRRASSSATQPATGRNSSPRRAAWLLAVGGAALLLRAWHIAQIAPAPFFDLRLGDAFTYDAWARTIAGGDRVGRGVFYQAPLYPYFLALVYRTIGSSVLVVRSVQAVVGAAACVLLADAGWRLFSKRAGLAAGLLLAAYPPAIFLDTIVQKSALDNFFLCLVLWLIALVAGRPRSRTAVWLGVALGLLMLTRENAAVLILPIGLWLIWSARLGPSEMEREASAERGSARLAALFAAGVALAVLPVTIRNVVVGGELAVTTAQFGPNFYIGNNPDADGTYKPLVPWRGNARFEQQDATELAERALGRRLTPGEVSAYFRSRALAFIRAEPGRWLRLLGRKLALTVNAVEVSDTEDQYTYARWSWPLKLGAVWNFGVLLPLALAGMWIARRDWRVLWVLHAVVALYAASVVLFYVFGRYRFPLVPPLMLFAGAALAGLPALVRTRPRVELAGVAALCAAAAVACEWPLMARSRLEAVTHYNVGAALGRAGRTEAAIREYRTAVGLDPALPMAHYNLGIALDEAGRADEAAAEFRATLRRSPRFADAHNNLGTILARKGRADGAVREFREAIRLDPGNAEAHNNLGQMLAAGGLADQAAAEYDRAAALDPAYVTPWRNLARLRVDQGRTADALAAAEHALRLAPEDKMLLNLSGVLLARTGRFEEAAERFERALAVDPTDAAIRRNLDKVRKASHAGPTSKKPAV